MYATTPRIYRDQKAPRLQDRLSINALDFHEQIIDSGRNGGSEKTEGMSEKENNLSPASNRNLIPKPTDRLNPDLGQITQKFSPQSGNDKIDTRRIDILLLRPGIPNKLIPCHGRIHLPDQTLEQQKLPTSNSDPPPPKNKLPRSRVERRFIGSIQNRRKRSGTRTAKRHPRHANTLQSLQPLMHFNE
jgi:hypothetical protein